MPKFKKGESGNPATVFKKGEVANPAGRPVGSLNRSTILRKWLNTPHHVTGFDGATAVATAEDAMALAIISRVIKRGDAFAYQQVLDSVYGKQPTTTNLGVGGENGEESDGSEIQVTIKRGPNAPATTDTPAAPVAPLRTPAGFKPAKAPVASAAPETLPGVAYLPTEPPVAPLRPGRDANGKRRL